MPTIDLPDDATSDDVRRVKETARVVRRNVRIRRDYPDLRDRYGWEQAREMLADRHACSRSTVDKVLEGRR